MGTKKVNRSSITGRFVTDKTVKRHPKTTITQNVQTPKKTNK